ncbi:MAG TPA: serine/threonine-protein kinase [Gemmatimonadales bacterium]|nr:serine/threonine-protein kinase [Gemmatimonadales bacterium]
MSDDSTRFRQLMDIVGDALELPGAQREQFVRERCGSDTAMCDDAMRLVAQHTSDPGADDLHGRVSRMSAMAGEAVPASIGSFEVVEVLGRGGMGVVYGALQHQPMRREVAIKVLLGTAPSMLARFAAEREMLARLDHPGIATVHDAGTTESGQPYLVMEWVRGEPITHYCANNTFGVEQRVGLFVQVCMAVHHAHIKGVIHRDLKPSNILVTEVDGQPVAKIIDFGIARVVTDEPGMDTAHTAHGTILGTLEYMSPEQATGSSTDVDARYDV